MRTGFILFFAALAAFALAGCTQDSVTDFHEAQAELAENPSAMDGLISCDVLFGRRVGKKNGKVFGAGDEFTMGEKSSVGAAVRFGNVEVGKTYAVHLVWLRPDMHEMFRYYAEVTLEENPEGGYVTRILKKKMGDKGYLREKTVEGDDLAFQLSSKLTTSWKKNREPGTYTLRVYMHREFLYEESVELHLGDKPIELETETETELDSGGGAT
jgi:hypothetical protein